MHIVPRLDMVEYGQEGRSPGYWVPTETRVSLPRFGGEGLFSAVYAPRAAGSLAASRLV